MRRKNSLRTLLIYNIVSYSTLRKNWHPKNEPHSSARAEATLKMAFDKNNLLITLYKFRCEQKKERKSNSISFAPFRRILFKSESYVIDLNSNDVLTLFSFHRDAIILISRNSIYNGRIIIFTKRKKKIRTRISCWNFIVVYHLIVRFALEFSLYYLFSLPALTSGFGLPEDQSLSFTHPAPPRSHNMLSFNAGTGTAFKHIRVCTLHSAHVFYSNGIYEYSFDVSPPGIITNEICCRCANVRCAASSPFQFEVDASKNKREKKRGKKKNKKKNCTNSSFLELVCVCDYLYTCTLQVPTLQIALK